MIPKRLIIFEPRTEGHHLPNLRLIIEALVSTNYELWWIGPGNAGSANKLRTELGPFGNRVNLVLPPYQLSSISQTLAYIAEIVRNNNGDSVVFPTFDEVASAMFRRAAFGLFPDRVLRGKIIGIYMRPRFLARCGLSVNQWLKLIGFARMVKEKWLSLLLFLDPYLCASLRNRWPGAPFFYLPDPFPQNFEVDRSEARRQLSLPAERRVFLFYGGPYRRKGLHLVISAFERMSNDTAAFLLFAGHKPQNARIAKALERFASEGRAFLIKRYVTDTEERLLFGAADFVLLPYVGHFGSSGVLSRAAGARRPVIASDEGLVGRLVREHNLGLLFSTGNVDELAVAMRKAMQADPSERERWQFALAAYARTCSFDAFRDALMAALGARSLKYPSPTAETAI